MQSTVKTALSEHVELDRALTILRRRWWLILLIALLGAGLSYGLSRSQPKKYTATASILFEQSGVNSQASGLQAGSSPGSQDPTVMATNVQLLSGQSGLAGATARTVGHGLTAADVSQAISVAQEGQTNVATVSATNLSPTLAAAIANNYVAQFIAAQRQQQQQQVLKGLLLVERQIASLSRQQLAGTSGQALLDRAESLRILRSLQNGGARVVGSAKPPAGPSSPKVVRNTVLGFVLGLILCIAVVFVIERVDRRMKTVEDLEATYQLPLLSAVPRNKTFAHSPMSGNSNREHNEVFKLLHAYLRYFNVDREIRSLVVASASPGDGKTTIARNLAQAAQETGTKTLLIEADMRRPNLAKTYGLRAAPGLSEVLVGSAQRYDAITQVPIVSAVNGRQADAFLDVLVAGHPPPNPVELIESQAMATLLAWAAGRYELVVVDTPPLSVVSDAIPLLRRVDGVVIVSRLGTNRRDAAAFLRQRLESLDAPLLGVIANGIKAGKEGYGYGYGHDYGSGEYSAAPADDVLEPLSSEHERPGAASRRG